MHVLDEQTTIRTINVELEKLDEVVCVTRGSPAAPTFFGISSCIVAAAKAHLSKRSCTGDVVGTGPLAASSGRKPFDLCRPSRGFPAPWVCPPRSRSQACYSQWDCGISYESSLMPEVWYTCTRPVKCATASFFWHNGFGQTVALDICTQRLTVQVTGGACLTTAPMCLPSSYGGARCAAYLDFGFPLRAMSLLASCSLL